MTMLLSLHFLFMIASHSKKYRYRVVTSGSYTVPFRYLFQRYPVVPTSGYLLRVPDQKGGITGSYLKPSRSTEIVTIMQN